MNDCDYGEYEDEYDYNNPHNNDDWDNYEDSMSAYLAELDWEAYRKSWRGRLDRIIATVKSRLYRAKCWLKWHNRKCAACGKPALYDGDICDGCFIPF